MSGSQKSGVTDQLIESGELFRRIILIGIAVCAVLSVYHRFVIGLCGVPGLVAPITGLLLAAILAVFHLRQSLDIAAAMFLCTGLAAITALAILNGGLAFHVLMWSLLIPIAVPASWPRFFAVSILACVAVYTTLFVVEMTGYSAKALIDRSALRGLIIDFISLSIVGTLTIIISRSKSRQTFQQICSRDKFQRALLQSQKLGSLGRVTDSLVHDFNNVLMTMDYSLFLLRQTISKQSPSLEEVEILETSVRSAIGLSKRLSAMGAERSKQVSVLVIDSVVAELEKVARRVCHPEIRLSVDLGCLETTVSISRAELDQVLLNLVANASDAIGGKGTIVLRTRNVGETVTIDVVDSGPGIDDALEETLFDAFITTKKAGVGSGLGLWSSQTVARECGGELALVASDVPGATLRLTLPASQSANKQQKLPRAIGLPEKKTANVGALAPVTRACHRLFGPVVEGVSEPRSRLWGIVIAATGMLGAFFWWAFAAWYWIGFDARSIGTVMVLAGLFNSLCPLVIRFTSSVQFAIGLLGTTNLVGLGVIAILRGDFSLEVLVCLLILPLLATMQREYRRLAPLAILFCSTVVLGSFIVVLTGIGPEPFLVLSARSQAIESFAVLLAVLTLLGFAVRVGYGVDEQIAAEGEQFRLALLGAEKAETLGIFASSIAHDLNNILMSFDFGLVFLDESLPAGHRGRTELGALSEAGNRIRRLSKELVRFGRNDETDTDTVSIDDSLRGLESMARPLIGRHVELQYRLQAPNSQVAMPVKRFEQLILNLMLSGREAGAQTIAIETELSDHEIVINLAGVLAKASRPQAQPDRSDDSAQLMWLCQSIVDDAGGRMISGAGSTANRTLIIRLPRLRLKRRGLTAPRNKNETPVTIPERPTIGA